MAKRETKALAQLIDALEAKLFPHQESEQEQESFTPEGRLRVAEWIREQFPAEVLR